MQIQPYLFFNGRAEEAINFYGKTIGAEVLMLVRFKEAPQQGQQEGCAPGPYDPEKVMHATVRIGESEVLVSDGECKGQPDFHGFSLSLTASTDAEAKRSFDALADGGEVSMPLSPTFFASSFGMLKDRFGVNWMVVSGTNK